MLSQTQITGLNVMVPLALKILGGLYFVYKWRCRGWKWASRASCSKAEQKWHISCFYIAHPLKLLLNLKRNQLLQQKLMTWLGSFGDVGKIRILLLSKLITLKLMSTGCCQLCQSWLTTFGLQINSLEDHNYWEAIAVSGSIKVLFTDRL